MRIHLILSLVLVLGLSFTGCATKRTAGWESAGGGAKLNKSERRALMVRGKNYWAKRQDKNELEKGLKAFEKVASATTDRKEKYRAMVFLARGYYLLADAHTDDKEQKKMIWEVGTSWGERAMATNPSFATKITEVEGRVEEALDTLTKREIEGIYWTAVNLGKWGKAAGIVTILKYKSRIKKMVNKVGELDRKFFHGAFYRYWGAYYAVAPSFAGGDMNKSRDNFEQAIKAQKGYLGTHVLYAELYATKKGDKSLFMKKLNYVIKAKTSGIPSIRPENIMEKRKAKKLLAQIDDLF